MRKNKKGFVIAIMLLLTGILGIGYAALTTTLNITGSSSITKASWDVHFENITEKSGSVSAITAPSISGNTISYSFNLVNPGDYYEFTVDVKNSGTIDAKLATDAIVNGLVSDQDTYTNYTVTYNNGNPIKANDTLVAGETKTIKVHVEFDKNLTPAQLPTSEVSLNLNYSMEYIQN